jgi:hypothetical protein
MSVRIDGLNGAEWTGTLESFTQLEDGRYSAGLSGSICGEECELIPIDGETQLSARVDIVPETRGPVIPVSALLLEPSGGTAVRMASGAVQAVDVLAEADGFAVVDGIAVGALIQLPAKVE